MEARRGRRAKVTVAIVLVSLSLAFWLFVTAHSEQACYQVKHGARGFHRTWVWVPVPHWACDYPDGSTANFWPWDVKFGP